MKVAFIIPLTSRNRLWENINESYLVKYTLTSFKLNEDEKHSIWWYFGIDEGEKIYTEEELKKLAPNVKVFTVEHEKGDIVDIWNKLFKLAYDDGMDYFYQCGDDIKFYNNSSGWLSESIKLLQENDDIGTSGCISDRTILKLTQSLVSRKHMEIFGYYFPPSITNLGCDEWLNYVYQPFFYFPIDRMKYFNHSSAPRYDNRTTYYPCLKFSVQASRKILSDYLDKNQMIIKIPIPEENRLEKLNKAFTRIHVENPELYRRALVVLDDKHTVYSPNRIDNIKKYFYKHPYIDIMGCYNVPFKLNEIEKKELNTEFKIYKKSNFNNIFLESMSFRLSFLKHHKFRPETEEDVSIYEMGDYIALGVQKYNKHIEYINETSLNNYLLYLVKNYNFLLQKFN